MLECIVRVVERATVAILGVSTLLKGNLPVESLDCWYCSDECTYKCVGSNIITYYQCNLLHRLHGICFSRAEALVL